MTASSAPAETSTVVSLTRELVGFDTVNPPGNEAGAIRHLAAYLEARGVDCTVQDIGEEGRANLIARLSGRGERGHLVLSGHMDTVPLGDPALWEHQPLGGEIVNGRMYGRGTTDMKGGVAAMAVALANLHDAGFAPAGDIILAVTSGEERGMNGARYIADHGTLEGSAYLVVGEPSAMQICTAQKGGMRWKIDIHGIPAHSSTPHLGVSAIAFAAQLIPALEVNPFEYDRHPLCGDSTVTITNIKSEGAGNVVPAHCEFLMGVRCLPNQDTNGMQRRLDETIEEVKRRTGMDVRVETTFMGGAAGIETPGEHDLVQAAIEAVETAIGRRPQVVGFTGGTEAGIYHRSMPIPFIIFGPGDLQVAHQTDEWVEVSELEEAVTAYEGIARRLLG